MQELKSNYTDDVACKKKRECVHFISCDPGLCVHESLQMLLSWKVHHPNQQQTAADQSVAHTGVTVVGGEGRRGGGKAPLDPVDSTRHPPPYPILTSSPGLITLIDRREPFRRKPSSVEPEERRGGWGGEETAVVWSHMTRGRKCVGGWGSSDPGLMGTHLLLLVLDRSSGSSARRGSPSSSSCEQRGSTHGKMTIKFVVTLFTLLLAQGARWVSFAPFNLQFVGSTAGGRLF